MTRIRLPALACACILAGGAWAWGQEEPPQEAQAAEQASHSEAQDEFQRRDRRSLRDAGERSSAEPDPFRESYAVLLENNMFLRDRRPARPPAAPTTREAAPPPPPEKSWMLVGIVFEEGKFHAYFENLQSNSVVRTTVGEAIANGAVAELYIDAIAYSTDNGVSWIGIGQDLTGAYPEGLATASRSRNGSSGERSAQRPADPNTLSIEERLRQRRLQESGGATIQVQMKDGVLITPEGKPVQTLEGVQIQPGMRFERASGTAERSERGPDEPPERRERGSDDPPPDDPDDPAEDPDRR